MEIPNVDLCKKLITNLKGLKEKDGVFVEGAKKAEKTEKKSDWLLGNSLPSILTNPARMALLVLTAQLDLQSSFNIKNFYSSPSDFDAMLKRAEETIAMFE